MNDVLKPYVLLACVAFIAGFVGYLALGRILISPAARADDWQASIPARAAPPELKRRRPRRPSRAPGPHTRRSGPRGEAGREHDWD